jgi:N,N'-diacetyllegionaminate synthase
MGEITNIGIRDSKESIKPYIIAEAGINHNGKIDLAIEMIEIAKASGADAVKFQTFKASEFCGDKDQLFTYKSQGRSITEPMFDLFERVEFKPEQWAILKKHSEQVKIEFLSTPQNLSDLKILLPLGIKAIKIGSDDLTNIPLIKKYSSFDLPIILSSGMSDVGEIHKGIEAAGWFLGKKVSVLICTSLYPTPDKDASVSRVSTLQDAFPGLQVGFSDHTIGNNAAVLALALGARIFEKHFTLDHNYEGPDHWFSSSPSELNSWVQAINDSFVLLGSPQLVPSESELSNKKEFRRVVVAISEIKKGELFEDQNIGLRRISGGKGLSPNYLANLFGSVADKNYKIGDAIDK